MLWWRKIVPMKAVVIKRVGGACDVVGLVACTGWGRDGDRDAWGLVYGFRLRVGLGARARDLDRSPKAAQHRLNWSPSLTETCDGQLEFRSVTMVTNL
uniref:Uncharacterized protein n=1 Tax=Fagus sylvatica TaxID=28930 RepID=A0A2N9H8M8_FAGSY